MHPRPEATAAPAPATARSPGSDHKGYRAVCLPELTPSSRAGRGEDEAFASGALGDGMPLGTMVNWWHLLTVNHSTFETHHAVGMTTVDGAELLMHIGIDTVQAWKALTYLVNEGDKVKKASRDPHDLEAIKAERLSCDHRSLSATPMTMPLSWLKPVAP